MFEPGPSLIPLVKSSLLIVQHSHYVVRQAEPTALAMTLQFPATPFFISQPYTPETAAQASKHAFLSTGILLSRPETTVYSTVRLELPLGFKQ